MFWLSFKSLKYQISEPFFLGMKISLFGSIRLALLVMISQTSSTGMVGHYFYNVLLNNSIFDMLNFYMNYSVIILSLHNYLHTIHSILVCYDALQCLHYQWQWHWMYSFKNSGQPTSLKTIPSITQVIYCDDSVF